MIIFTILRSLLFNLCFAVWSFSAAFLLAPLFVFSGRATQLAGPIWGHVSLFMLRAICGIRHEVRGREHMPMQAAIIASKHQSAWDTIIFLLLLPAPAFVLKRELLRIPFWGWYLWRMKMIAIDRSAGASSIKHMTKQARQAIADNRSIVIFPEGTRTRPGAQAHYHPGLVALYSMLDAPVVPVALNSGLFWGKNAFLKRPGTIVIEFLPPVPPGLPKNQLLPRVQDAVETASNRLLQET